MLVDNEKGIIMRIAQWKSPDYIRQREEFSAGSLSGYNSIYDKTYKVMSYNTCIAQWDGGVWLINDTYYSATTARHFSYVRRAFTPYEWINDTVHLVHVRYNKNSLRDEIMCRVDKTTYRFQYPAIIDRYWRIKDRYYAGY